MTDIARRPERPGWPDLIDWLEHGIPSFLRPPTIASLQAMRVEEYLEEGRYVLRAELPGIDPSKDVEIILSGGVLTVRAERREERKEEHRSEFHYGSFERRITVPPNANEDDVTATYANGILEVSVGLAEVKQEEAKRIAVTVN
jgi:HSP20 family protein